MHNTIKALLLFIAKAFLIYASFIIFKAVLLTGSISGFLDDLIPRYNDLMDFWLEYIGIFIMAPSLLMMYVAKYIKPYKSILIFLLMILFIFVLIPTFYGLTGSEDDIGVVAIGGMAIFFQSIFSVIVICFYKIKNNKK